ncbi:galactose-binding domain-like protein [Limtongia smithiae]|uniref:galactose-binding domain-like protein n=1 Tax=Limtongia smithiae TaxID=1125753 RepID=UPI0034CF3ADD
MAVSVVDIATFEAQIRSSYSDVIGAKLGGAVHSCSDEFFAEASNLLSPRAPIRDKTRYTHQGAWYDGWETRRHNPAEADWVIVHLGVASARVVGCEIDTAFFDGNHAPSISVEAAFIPTGAPDESTEWMTVIARTECGPTQRQFFVRVDGLTKECYNYVRLKMYPDGGIARFRLYGTPVPVFPAMLDTELDLASVGNGGVAIACSDQRFGTVDNLLLPGRGIDMSDGWETTRSRISGHEDWVVVRLGARGAIRSVIVDTAFFRGNFPDRIRVEAIDAASDEAALAKEAIWTVVAPTYKAEPDKEHPLKVENSLPATHVKLVMIPDGGVKRLRVFATRLL